MVSPVAGPKYLSVREHLRRRVAALPEHTLLPPEPVLCAEYGVSRITLRRAVDGLVADGHLVREQGRGTYVTRPAIRHEYRESFVHRIAGFNSVMTEQGAQVGTTVLTQRVVPAAAGDRRRAVPRRRRGRRRAGPAAQRRRRCPTTSPQLPARRPVPQGGDGRTSATARSTSYLRREYEADLAHARIVVDVGTAAADEAELLDVVAGSPLLVVRTTVRDSARPPAGAQLLPAAARTSARSSSRSRSAAA